ncbi:universal stress protein [Paracoccus tegillarcae]|uniref:Universal stress protein n=1 Tax=Paracoccus tegillarcae TaxID=1529068 RepID=A0A2K9EIW6_9RHOB|nr:universal stress protein [Paracoccus tegillarcae]AUH34319.1 universal stress protein [Paracoccus tegillarcae]
MTIELKKILVASDGSKNSRRALLRAGAIAKATGADLHVIHVGLLSRYTNPDQMNSNQYDRLKTEARSRLDNELEFAEENGIKVTKSHLRMGRVDSEVIRLGEEIGADMIAIGNRGMGALERILLGSDAESIVRHAPCDVIVFRDDE